MPTFFPSFASGRNSSAVTMGALQKLMVRKEQAAQRDIRNYPSPQYSQARWEAESARASAHQWTDDKGAPATRFLESKASAAANSSKSSAIFVAQNRSKSFPSKEHSFANMPKAAQDYSRKALRQQRKPIPEYMQKGFTPSNTAGLGKYRRG